MNKRFLQDAFNKEQAESYDTRWEPLRPFNTSLHLQLGLIFEELPQAATLLCVGAGTGAEIIALAERFPEWRFVAVDPSESMMEVCRHKLEERGLLNRCRLYSCYLHEIPDTETDFDGATSILVSHFILDRDSRLGYFREIARRLRSGGLMVTSDLSKAPRGQQAELMKVWQRMMELAGATPEQIEGMIKAYQEGVSMLPEEAFEEILNEAGFGVTALFAQSLLIRSWVARKT